MERLLSLGPLLGRIGVASLTVCLLAWCGEDRFQVSGVVLFDGEPVPAGKIYFIPDESKGNRGAAGYATIHNGGFDTAARGGKATAGGPMIVGIEGVDPAVRNARRLGDTSREQTVKSLFPYYKTTAILPKANSTTRFNVPASAANRDSHRAPSSLPSSAAQ